MGWGGVRWWVGGGDGGGGDSGERPLISFSRGRGCLGLLGGLWGVWGYFVAYYGFGFGDIESHSE